jgi:hypothetical protein
MRRRVLFFGLLLVGLAACGARDASPSSRAVRDTAHVILATYLGGTRSEMGRDVAFDHDGSFVAVGSTRSPDFPVTPGAFQTAFHPGKHDGDAWVARFGPDGRLRWATYLGGPNYERAYAVEIAPDGDIVVGGRGGDGLPVGPHTAQPTFGGGEEDRSYGAQDGFVCRLSPDGQSLRFCTYFGTRDNRILRDLALDGAGNIVVAAGVDLDEFPRAWFAHAFQPRIRGDRDVVIAKLAADGSRVLWATYLGGSGFEDEAPSVRVGTGDTVYVLLNTRSTDLPTPGAGGTRPGGSHDMYLAKLAPDGSRLLYGTYIGGSGIESIETHGLAVDREGNAYVAAGTNSADFPTTPNAVRQARDLAPGDSGEAFVVKVGPDGRILAATLLGGREKDWSEGVAVDAQGYVYLSGATNSPDFPAPATGDGGARHDLIAVKLSPALDRIVWAARLGGDRFDAGRSAAVSDQGDFAVAGMTQSADLPVREAAQPARRGPDDAVVTLFRPTR